MINLDYKYRIPHIESTRYKVIEMAASMLEVAYDDVPYNLKLKLLDVAGLVPGAHLGKGMGNQFLNDLLPADILIHVVDVSGSVNEKGEQVEVGSYDPVNDIKFLEFELDMWYLASVKKGWDKFARTVQQAKTPIHKALAVQLSSLKVTEDMVKEEL